MQPELLSLAARVEELTGPDREVDAEVAIALDSKQRGCRLIHVGHGLIRIGEEGRQCFMVDSFTASADAVIALIEREMLAARLVMTVGDNYSSAQIVTGWGGRKRTLCPQIERPDTHVAICAIAAFLRAKAAQQQMEARREIAHLHGL